MDPWVRSMASVRMLSSMIELTGAILMLRSGQVRTAVGINAGLGLVGPTIFAVTSALGIAGLEGSLPLHKLVLVGGGVLLVLLGALR